MSKLIPEPTLWDDAGVPETVYLRQLPSLTTEDGWLVSSLDVASWRELAVGDRVIALDYDSRDEFLVEVADVDASPTEVFYRLRHLADLDPSFEPRFDGTRTWLTTETTD